jgi:aminopeptidase
VNVGGRLIDDVSMRFESGHVVSISGGEGIEALREFVQRDDGTERLGEVALVDRESAVAKAAQTFGVILLDENAASHVALGFGFPELTAEEDRQLVNDSGDHLDVMVGSDELEIIGLRADGEEHALLRGGEWMLST